MNKLIKTNIKGLKFAAKLNKRLLPSIALNKLFSSLSPYVNIYMSAEIVKELAGGRDTQRLLFLVLITIAGDLTIALFKGLINKYKERQQQEFNFAEQRLFVEYGFKMDYAHMENPEIQARRAKIDESKNINYFGIQNMLFSFENVVDQVINVVLSVCFAASLFTIVAANIENVIGMILFPASLVLLIILSVFVSVRNSKKLGKNYSALSNTMMNTTRISRGFPSAYQMGKDIRIYDMGGIRQRQAVINRENYKKVIRKMMLGNARANIPANVASGTLDFAVYAFVCLNAVRGVFGIDGVIKYVGYISRLVNAVKYLFGSTSGPETNLPFLEQYLEFFEIQNEMRIGTLPVEKRMDNEYEIEFKNVSFRYPGKETYALKNLSMRLNVGQRLAVVGMNGSGKTTMIKLLCRLYDPTEGVITLNGIDIKKYDYDEYLRIFSVVFQDFKLFSFMLGQNVASAVNYEADKAKSGLLMAGFGERLDKTSNGLETPLYKDFETDGMEVSGGEAQKIALARALYKDAPFVILDEPTSALDPVAEFEIYSRFDDIVGNKTAIYISHRLSSCRFCDDIAVFNEGELIQRGNHETLIADENNKYYELWHAQAQYYNEKSAS